MRRRITAPRRPPPLSNIVDEVYLLANASAPGVSATNNWLTYPQYFGADPAGGGYPIEWSTRSSGSDVLVIYNSAWTNDANAVRRLSRPDRAAASSCRTYSGQPAPSVSLR